MLDLLSSVYANSRVVTAKKASAVNETGKSESRQSSSGAAIRTLSTMSCHPHAKVKLQKWSVENNGR